MRLQNRLMLGGLMSAWMLCGVSARANDPTCAEPVPVPAKCCWNPCISYEHRGRSICCCECAPIQTALQVTDPCTCCTIEVPVCLPGCCTGSPAVCSRCPILFNREVIKFEYCCGVTVVVKISKCGDILVTYWHA